MQEFSLLAECRVIEEEVIYTDERHLTSKAANVILSVPAQGLQHQLDSNLVQRGQEQREPQGQARSLDRVRKQEEEHRDGHAEEQLLRANPRTRRTCVPVERQPVEFPAVKGYDEVCHLYLEIQNLPLT